MLGSITQVNTQTGPDTEIMEPDRNLKIFFIWNWKNFKIWNWNLTCTNAILWYIPPLSTRSQNLSLLAPTIAKSTTFGERSFKFSAPKLWNKMPLHMQEHNDLDGFKNNVKTYLFKN